MKRAEVGARELKTRLGRYLRRVRGGATLVITDRGQPVAELHPIGAGDPESARLRQLAALGLVTVASTNRLPRVRSVRAKRGSASRTIVTDRDDRF